ncbi:MAG: hypothetical protein HAW67_02070, partial [Endozoicomonadaceae bacterium]|nr:hypothetical protein [Endozoicomonadaceae bacterium]
HLFDALEQALINILHIGVEQHYALLKQRAELLRKGLLRLGLKFLINEKSMCSVLTTVRLPAHVDVGLLRQRLRDKSIIIYEGKGCFANKVFQIGNIGELSDANIQFFLASLNDVLSGFPLVKEEPNFISDHLRQGYKFSSEEISVNKSYSSLPLQTN